LFAEDVMVGVFDFHSALTSRIRKGPATFKVKMRCNRIDCAATRNVYLTVQVAKFGKVKREGKG
jgi:hypothetical protein